MKNAILAACASASLLVLAACGVNSAASGTCPRIGVLPDAADLPVKNGTGEVVALARLSVSNSPCVYNKSRVASTGFSTVEFTLTVRVAAAATKAVRVTSVKAPYLVATVAPDGVVTGRQRYEMNVDISDRTGSEDDRIKITLPYEGSGNASGHRIVVAFQLDEETVRLNRSRLGR